MATSPVLTVRVEPALKAEFQAVVKANRTTEARLLRSLVEFFLKRTPLPDQADVSPDTTGIRSERVTLRLTPAEYADLTVRVRAQGMSKGSYLAALFKAQATGQPQFSEAEMQALREATRELTAIGRNLNQIARVLNTSRDHADRARAVEFETLHAQIERHRQAVKALIKANLRSWGVEG